jgi:hypothetical protein
MALKPSKDFSFLTDDLKRQQEIAQEALNEAKRLDAVLNDAKVPPELKPELERAKASFLRVARELAANANTTSTSAITLIGSTAK